MKAHTLSTSNLSALNSGNHVYNHSQGCETMNHLNPARKYHMSDAMIYDHPDFEPNPMNPSVMLHEIIDLARQCYEQRKAFVSVQIFGGTQGITVILHTDFTVTEYVNLGEYMLVPVDFDKCEMMNCNGDDAHYLQGIVLKLQAIVGGA
mgnify:FL=1